MQEEAKTFGQYFLVRGRAVVTTYTCPFPSLSPPLPPYANACCYAAGPSRDGKRAPYCRTAVDRITTDHHPSARPSRMHALIRDFVDRQAGVQLRTGLLLLLCCACPALTAPSLALATRLSSRGPGERLDHPPAARSARVSCLTRALEQKYCTIVRIIYAAPPPYHHLGFPNN